MPAQGPPSWKRQESSQVRAPFSAASRRDSSIRRRRAGPGSASRTATLPRSSNHLSTGIGSRCISLPPAFGHAPDPKTEADPERDDVEDDDEQGVEEGVMAAGKSGQQRAGR